MDEQSVFIFLRDPIVKGPTAIQQTYDINNVVKACHNYFNEKRKKRVRLVDGNQTRSRSGTAPLVTTTKTIPKYDCRHIDFPGVDFSSATQPLGMRHTADLF